MSHFDEFTLMMYIDNELPADERMQIADHLAACRQCQELHAQLFADEQLFQSVFRTDEEHERAPLALLPLTQAQVEAIAALHRRNNPSLLSRSLWVMSAVAAVLLYLTLFQNEWVQRLSLAWSHMLSEALWALAFWVRDTGTAMLSLAANGYAITLLFTTLLGALFLLNMRRPTLGHWEQPKERD